MKTQNTNIGLFGYGVVGKGFYKLSLDHPQLKINTKRIVIKHRNKHVKAEHVSNTVHSSEIHFSLQAGDILNDKGITTIVELINNSEDAYRIAKNVLENGNTLITANKKMLADHFIELLELEKLYGGCLLYEASSAASIPIIRLLDTYFANEEIRLVEGILNGTSNFILSSIFNNNITFKEALNQAQIKGFAESDPTLDITGLDALNKLIIINAHAFGVIVKTQEVFNYGITHLDKQDIEFARQNGFVIKQVAHASVNPEGKLLLYVAPQFVKPQNPLRHVDSENNGIVVDAVHSGKQFYSGKGAGGSPTGAAVLADVISSAQHKNYTYTKLRKPVTVRYDDSLSVSVYLRYSKVIKRLPFKINVKKHYVLGEFNFTIGYVSLKELILYKVWLEANEVSLIILS
ncbi:MAG: homoserine dehydrogenase [Bacteroidota bacterium]|nr:homoserine dehydrogenase [Bacteroidota bacterium]